MNEQKIIIGFVGEMCAGKGTAVSYLSEKYGAASFSFSAMLRDVLDRLRLPHTRDNMIDLSVWLRGRFGENTMARAMAADIDKTAARIVAVEGIRREADIEELQKNPRFTLVEITSGEQTRYARLTARDQNEGDSQKTLDEFRADARKPTEASIRAIAARAKARVDNNGTLEDLHRQLDGLVRRIEASNS